MNATTPTTQSGAYKSLLYWRKNLWNGSDCVPVILVLEDGTLSMKASDGTIIFSDSLDKVIVRFTGWGTMILTVDGKKIDIVGMPAATSPEVSDLQKAELSDPNSDANTTQAGDRQPTVLGSAAATATGNAGATVIGATVSTAVYYKGLGSIREWKSLIGSAKDQKRTFNNMTYLIAIGVVVLIVAIILK